jgi:hypothetical protein
MMVAFRSREDSPGIGAAARLFHAAAQSVAEIFGKARETLCDSDH